MEKETRAVQCRVAIEGRGPVLVTSSMAWTPPQDWLGPRTPNKCSWATLRSASLLGQPTQWYIVNPCPKRTKQKRGLTRLPSFTRERNRRPFPSLPFHPLPALPFRVLSRKAKRRREPQLVGGGCAERVSARIEGHLFPGGHECPHSFVRPELEEDVVSSPGAWRI